jgi:hypothetical protein
MLANLPRTLTFPVAWVSALRESDGSPAWVAACVLSAVVYALAGRVFWTPSDVGAMAADLGVAEEDVLRAVDILAARGLVGVVNDTDRVGWSVAAVPSAVHLLTWGSVPLAAPDAGRSRVLGTPGGGGDPPPDTPHPTRLETGDVLTDSLHSTKPERRVAATRIRSRETTVTEQRLNTNARAREDLPPPSPDVAAVYPYAAELDAWVRRVFHKPGYVTGRMPRNLMEVIDAGYRILKLGLVEAGEQVDEWLFRYMVMNPKREAELREAEVPFIPLRRFLAWAMEDHAKTVRGQAVVVEVPNQAAPLPPEVREARAADAAAAKRTLAAREEEIARAGDDVIAGLRAQLLEGRTDGKAEG